MELRLQSGWVIDRGRVGVVRKVRVKRPQVDGINGGATQARTSS